MKLGDYFFFYLGLLSTVYILPDPMFINGYDFLTGMLKSRHPDVFRKKSVLRNFTNFTGEHLCQGLFFSKVAGLRSAILLKRRPWRRCFPVNFAKFLRTSFLTEHLRRLLMYGTKCCLQKSETVVQGCSEKKSILKNFLSLVVACSF